jgi:toxin ParE1/3/4
VNRSVNIHGEAEIELAEAILWYEEHRQHLGEELLEQVRTAVARIGEGFDGSPYLEFGEQGATRRVLLDRFPYAIVFAVVSDTVHVLAFSHHHRRPGYWRDRTPGTSQGR